MKILSHGGPLPLGWAALVFCLLAGGCRHSPEAAGSAAPEPVPAGMPPRLSAEALRCPGADDLVLAEGRHGIVLTLAEYNARVDEVPLPVGSDTVQACWATLDRIVDHKVCAAEGRLRGYTADDPRNLRDEERQLARQVLEQGMLAAQLLPDDEALKFFHEHPALFPGLPEASLKEPALLTHVKFTLHNRRWRQQVDQWLVREKVVVHRDRFAALLRERGFTAEPAPRREGES